METINYFLKSGFFLHFFNKSKWDIFKFLHPFKCLCNLHAVIPDIRKI